MASLRGRKAKPARNAGSRSRAPPLGRVPWGRCWIFDLDNTLHNARPHIFPHINGAISIERTRFRPKPDAHGFLRLARANHVRARRCIMGEDTLANLRTAKKRGMKTVWVARGERAPRYADVKIANLGDLRRALPRLA